MAALWLSKFSRGTFRGVPFYLRQHQKKGGRRKQDHEFPQLDQNRSEDLGRKIARFVLDMYVIGDDYFPLRDALEAALNKSGKGRLIHPYLGKIDVQAGEYTLVETTEEGGMARFTVNFSEAGSDLFPAAVTNAISQVNSAADNMIEQSNNFIDDVFTVANTPAFVVQSLSNKVGALNDFIDRSIKKVTQPITNLTSALQSLEANVEELLNKPSELSARYKAAMADLLAEFETDPETATRIFQQFTTVDQEAFEKVTGDTPSRNRQRINEDVLLGFVKDLAAANNAKAIAQTPFTSTQYAIFRRDVAVAALEDRATEIADSVEAPELGTVAGDDDLFQANRDVQAALTLAVPQAGLGDQIRFTPPQTLPVLVIAHQLFGNVDKEQELIDQNAIEHPGFAQGNVELEVSSG